MSPRPRVCVATSAHWPGDPRLQSHVTYLSRAGWRAEILAHHPNRRIGRVLTSLRVVADMFRRRPSAVILVDPELHVIGSLAARFRGIRAVIDIHEDYSKAAAAREWIPEWLRPVVSVLARAWEWLGRRLADAVVVAAPELYREGDHLVMNIPDPTGFPRGEATSSGLVVYVGDVTRSRGALDMVSVLGALGEDHTLLLVGPVDEETRREMESLASSLGVSDHLLMPGRMDHAEAWGQAASAVAGLCLLHPLPAYRDAVATKVFEYMAAGIPPVVSDLPAQAALIQRIHPDLVCTTPEDASSVILRLSQDPEFREQVAEQARKLARERWEQARPDLAIQRAVGA